MNESTQVEDNQTKEIQTYNKTQEESRRARQQQRLNEKRAAKAAKRKTSEPLPW